MLPNQNFLKDVDEQRNELGFLTVMETIALSERGNVVLDPFSVLISKNTYIGENNTFYPNVVIRSDRDGAIKIDDQNVFFPATYMEASEGIVEIGSLNQFGEGGLTVKETF